MIKALTDTRAVIRLDKIGVRYYENSITSRTELERDCPPDIISEVMAVWGDTPTVPDPEPLPPLPDIPPAPSLDQRTAALEAAMLAMMGGSANV